MSLQWTLIATLLYSEMVFVALMLLPFISAARWSKIFKSRFLRIIEAQSAIYFYGVLGLLVLAFLDSIREMQKYSGEDKSSEHEHSHLDAQMQVHMKLFRAQRNFYIAGFTLFLFLVIKRMASLISRQALLQANNEASMKQAQTATAAAQRLMNEKEEKKPRKENEGNTELEKKEEKLQTLQEEVSTLKNELKSSQADKEAMKTQAESVTAEYDRLMTENQKLQDEINDLKGADKKSD